MTNRVPPGKRLPRLLVALFTLALLLPSAVAQVQRISIGSAGTSGTFYIVAAGIAEQISRELGIPATAEVTGGSVENARRMASGELELAMMQMDVGYKAYHGIDFDPQVDMLAIVPVYPNLQHVVVRANSDLHTLEDIKGTRVSIGSPGSGVLATNQTFLEALGWSLNDIKGQFLSFSENTSAFRDNAIDAALANTAAPTPWILDLETSHPIRLLPIDGDDLQRLLEQGPYYAKAEFPAGTYRGQDEAVTTFGLWVMLAARSDMPDDLVYDITKLIYESREALIGVHPAAANISIDNLGGIAIPFHPGAARYYRELGIIVDTP